MSEIISVEPINPELSTTYFALDGNYGTADGMVVVDTSGWTEEDWQAIDEVGDSDRASLALALAKHDSQEARRELLDAVLADDLDAQFDKAVERE